MMQLTTLKHIGKDLYEVPLNQIRLANDPAQSFINPRYSLSGYVDGLDEVHMNELHEGIRTEGLQNFPTVRLVDDAFQLIRGERRIRTLLRLVANSKATMCWDQGTSQWGRPAKVYENVVCHVVQCDDLGAFKIAFSDNDQAVGFSDACTAAFVRNLQERGCNDEDIMRITGKRISWLRDTYAINALDAMCRIAFENGEINRTIALELTDIVSDAERLARLKLVKAHAIFRHKQKIAHAEEDVLDAETKVELAVTNLATAQALDEDCESETLQLSASQSVLDKKITDFEKIKKQKPKGTTKDYQATGDGGKQVITVSKLEKQWKSVLEAMLEKDDFSEISKSKIQFTLHLVDCFLEGRNDVKDILLDYDLEIE